MDLLRSNIYRHILFFVAALAVMLPSVSHAQFARDVQKGNSLYDQKKYDEAAAAYAKALKKDSTNPTGLFNMGNSLYQQKKYDASRKMLESTAKYSKEKKNKSDATYNVGNTYMSEKKWEDAVKSYKQALRNNPQDADAKYNLSYAQQMLKQQQQQDKKDQQQKQDQQKQDQQKKDQKDKDKDKDKDKKDKDNKDKQDQKDKDKQDKNQGDKQDDKKDQQEPQGAPSKISPQQAEQVLNALQQAEKKLQDKMKEKKGVPVKMQKDW